MNVDNNRYQNNNNYNLLENILFVQTVMHPSLSNYNYDYSNGFAYTHAAPAYSSTYNNFDNAMNLAGGFGALAGGASGDW